jgi:hypothetical protein
VFLANRLESSYACRHLVPPASAGGTGLLQTSSAGGSTASVTLGFRGGGRRR